MLKAYFDESGIHAGSPVCIVAGFVLPSERADILEREWQSRLLSKYRIAYFHAKEFEARSGPFKGWSDDKAFSFQDRAAKLVSDVMSNWEEPHLIVGSAVVTKDFLSLPIEERRWLTGGTFVESSKVPRKWKKQGAPTKPYFLAFQQAVLDAAKFTTVDTSSYHRADPDQIVHFIFDRQNEYEATATAVFGAMKRMPLSIRGKCGDVVFSDKTRAIALQAADFMAYESFFYLRDRIRKGIDEIDEHAATLLGFSQYPSLLSRGRQVFIDGPVLQRLLESSPLRAGHRFVLPDPRYPFDSLSKKPPVTSYRG